jgi:DNA-binding transcriptional LysR family regulator
LNTRQLEALGAMLESGTVTAAAARLGVSQPAVSKLLASLERETGLVLFQRENKRLFPTAEARLLYEETDRHFVGLRRLGAIAEGLRTLKAGKLAIASLPALGLKLLPRLLARFVADKPDARIELQVRTSPTVIDWVLAPLIDLGVSLIPIEHRAVRSELLARVPGVCVLPPDHRLAARETITPEDLAGASFVSLGREDRARHMVDHAFARSGIERRMRIETPLSEVACEFVADGAGVSIVDGMTAALFDARRLVVRPFRPVLTFDLYLLTSAVTPLSQMAVAFKALLQDEMGRPAPSP